MKQREILFRGKRVDNGDWVYGNYYKPSGFISGVYISMDTTCCNFYPDLDEESDEPIDLSKQEPGISLGKFIAVMPETIGQYIGVEDMNKVKIFEDDIINGRISINVSITDTYWLNEISKYSDKIEVIGNIHDKN